VAKAVKHSEIGKEIKKEYLKEHLNGVLKLIEDWLPTLKAPPLIVQKGIWGWESVYLPVVEQDQDNNHVLRRHLKSRAFWSHHANWELKLNNIWQLTKQLHKDAYSKYPKKSGNMQIKSTPEYFTVALWKGFDTANGLEIDDWYKTPDNQQGVSYGAYKLELSVTSDDTRSLVKKEHLQLISALAQNTIMMQLVQLWKEVSTLQAQMYSIGNKALKSGDILYPCMFCKHLWQ